MNKLDICKLTINRNENILENGPIVPRCYEVIYSKQSNLIEVNIDKNEDKSKSIYKGEGLCGRWCYENDKYMLFFQINIKSEEDHNKLIEKNKEVRESIPLMIKAIRKVEEQLFMKNKSLEDAEIFIKFNCKDDEFYKVENWGKLKSYIEEEYKNEKISMEKDTSDYIAKQKNKVKMRENVILNLISYHIELFLFPRYGKNIGFLINDIEILSMEEILNMNGVGNDYEIVVSVKLLGKAGVEETILSILVRKNKVLVKAIA